MRTSVAIKQMSVLQQNYMRACCPNLVIIEFDVLKYNNMQNGVSGLGKIVAIYLSDAEARDLKFCNENQCSQDSTLKTAARANACLTSPLNSYVKRKIRYSSDRP